MSFTDNIAEFKKSSSQIADYATLECYIFEILTIFMS